MNKIDLHMHSSYSLDGEKHPNELIEIAKKSNIKYIAIADHNSCEAYHHINTDTEVNVIPSIELDCSFMEKNFHILAYFVDAKSSFFKTLREEINTMETNAGLHHLKYVQEEMGIKVDLDALKEIHPVGIYTGEGICEAALIIEENKTNPFLKEYYPGGTHSVSPHVDFYWEYCAQGKLAYTPIHFMKMQDAFKLMKEQNAFIVLAHPGNNTKEDLPLLEGISQLGLDGIEVYSSYHTSEQVQFYKEFAIEHNLIITCGSDYHGRHKPHIEMGNCHMPQTEEDALIKFIQTRLK